MKIRWSPVIVAVVAAAVGFVFESAGPVGSIIWPVADGMAEPGALALGLLMGMGVVEALAFGIGVSFLVFGWPWIKRVSGQGKAYAMGVYLSVAWLLVNWVPHTALHMNHGNIATADDYMGLAGIEYGFHFTLIVAGLFIAHFTLRSLRQGTFASRATAAEGPSTVSAMASGK